MKWIACAVVFLLTCTAHAYIDKDKIGWDQHLGATLPLDLKFKDAHGGSVRLGDLFNDRPVALAFVYLSCPELCPEVLAGIQQGFDQARLNSQDYEFIAVSIDPHDTPADATEKLRHLTQRASLHLLTAPNDNAGILARAAGFRYAYDPDHRQYAHPAGFLIATPSGTISRYFFGVRYDANELRAAVNSARGGGVSTVVRQLLLVCFHFDPTQGPYSATILTTLRVISLAMLAGAGLAIGMRLRHRQV